MEAYDSENRGVTVRQQGGLHGSWSMQWRGRPATEAEGADNEEAWILSPEVHLVVW